MRITNSPSHRHDSSAIEYLENTSFTVWHTANVRWMLGILWLTEHLNHPIHSLQESTPPPRGKDTTVIKIQKIRECYATFLWTLLFSLLYGIPFYTILYQWLHGLFIHSFILQPCVCTCYVKVKSQALLSRSSQPNRKNDLLNSTGGIDTHVFLPPSLLLTSFLLPFLPNLTSFICLFKEREEPIH